MGSVLQIDQRHKVWFDMRCPKCGCQDDKVIDSRASREGATIRRRRECVGCGHRYTTYEEIERAGLVIMKRDNRREELSKEKLLSGIRKACQKRPISPKVVEDLAENIVNTVTDKYEREVPAEVIGKLVMDGLREIDEVAYVRFASVYRRFQEATDFVQEVKKLESKQ
jgi:transcriptional repressor NrdR